MVGGCAGTELRRGRQKEVCGVKGDERRGGGRGIKAARELLKGGEECV